MRPCLDSLARDGFAMAVGLLDEPRLAEIEAAAAALIAGPFARQRGGSTYALRHVLSASPTLAELAASGALAELAMEAAGAGARAVRGIWFDKTPEANWKIAWHQDRTIAVRERVDIAGFGPWSEKLGVVHVEPPAELLESMVALRIHLDDCPADNGPLRMLPGSHRCGKLSPAEIAVWISERGSEAVTCTARRGDVLAMRPLTLHASSSAQSPTGRRVLHLEYCAQTLPGGLHWQDAPV